MTSDSESKGGQRASKKDLMVIAFVLVAIMLGATLLVIVMGAMDVLNPPYPSESTALRMVDGNVVWTGQVTPWTSDNVTSMDYRNLRLKWVMGSAGRETTGELADYTLLNGGSLVTVNRSLNFTYFVDTVEYSDVQQLQVTDRAGNGLFDPGDHITFDFGESGIPEDLVHTIALADVASDWSDEFSFAVHNGKFYSWNSSELPSDDPWWASL